MKSWSCFLIGNAIVVCVVIAEILTLDVCFEAVDPFTDDNLDPVQINADEAEDEDVEEAEATVYTMVMTALITGVSLEVFSMILLSWVYQAPLDAKSAWKIPPNDGRCLAGFVARFLAPLLWGLICICMGVASYLYASYESCGGTDVGETLQVVFLVLFGILMAISGALLVFISLLLACTSCGVEPSILGCCCSCGRQFMHKRVLSTAGFFDLWWQLSGVMWAYKTGAFTVQLTIILLIANVVGEVMSAVGSSAPLET